MMRKIFVIWITLCTAVTVFACGSGEPQVDGMTGATEQSGAGGDETASGKALIVYFSRAGENWQVGYVERGNTAIMVDYIKELADADVFEIVPEVPYPSSYSECIAYVNDIEVPQNLRPAYKNDITNLSDYKTVFIGGPIWWGQPPMIIRTFLEAHAELKDKTLIPFGTHGGSGIGSYTTLLKEYFPNATVLEALGISGSSIRDASSKTTVDSWLKRLGLDKASTGIHSTRAGISADVHEYSLNGMAVEKAQKGIYIKNGQKYIRK